MIPRTRSASTGSASKASPTRPPSPATASTAPSTPKALATSAPWAASACCPMTSPWSTKCSPNRSATSTSCRSALGDRRSGAVHPSLAALGAGRGAGKAAEVVAAGEALTALHAFVAARLGRRGNGYPPPRAAEKEAAEQERQHTRGDAVADVAGSDRPLALVHPGQVCVGIGERLRLKSEDGAPVLVAVDR